MKLLSKVFLLLFFLSINLFALNVDRTYNGWQGETIIKLSDNSFWLQEDPYVAVCLPSNPRVELVKDYNTIKMNFLNCSGRSITVTQIVNVIESRIQGEFKGFEINRVYSLENGSKWKQIQGTYWYNYTYNPYCIVYEHNGWKLCVENSAIQVERTYEDNSNSNSNFFNNASPSTSSSIFTITNLSNKTVKYCYAYSYGTNGWETVGWYKLAPNQSNDIDFGYYNGNIYLYIEDSKGKLIWNDPNSPYLFCIDKKNNFHYTNSDSRACSGKNNKQIQMIEKYISSGYNSFEISE